MMFTKKLVIKQSSGWIKVSALAILCTQMLAVAQAQIRIAVTEFQPRVPEGFNESQPIRFSYTPPLAFMSGTRVEKIKHDRVQVDGKVYIWDSKLESELFLSPKEDVDQQMRLKQMQMLHLGPNGEEPNGLANTLYNIVYNSLRLSLNQDSQQETQNSRAISSRPSLETPLEHIRGVAGIKESGKILVFSQEKGRAVYRLQVFMPSAEGQALLDSANQSWSNGYGWTPYGCSLSRWVLGRFF
jgi:hypothetical protein